MERRLTHRWRRRAERAPNPVQPYLPPFDDRRFWIVQGLVVGVAAIHFSIEEFELLEKGGGHVHSLTFMPISMFFVPVIYAALNFGFAGAVATALWCTVLAAPNIVVFHPGAERLAELAQLGIVDGVAAFVGHRVDRESTTRRLAEAAGSALRASETKYRDLFESSPAGVLVLDGAATVMDANVAAGAIFGVSPAGLKGVALDQLLGSEQAQTILRRPRDNGADGATLVLTPEPGVQVYLEASLIGLVDIHDGAAFQVILRDITLERHREAGLRAYAERVLHAQEDERKRMAQELHDETVQALVLLCRRLDVVEAASDCVPPHVTQDLRMARKSAEELVERLQDFARALRPPTLDDLGLVTSVRRLVVDLADRAGIEWHTEVDGRERRLRPDAELALYRIAQEALRNVERHAGATRVSVDIRFTEREVSLDVLDNGVGFVLATGHRDFATGGQLGLLGMKERAELLGGTLQVRTSPGTGTRVTVSVPTAGSVSHAVDGTSRSGWTM